MSIFGKWVDNAVASAGRAFGDAAHAVADVSTSIADRAKKIPIVGPALHAIVDLGFADQLKMVDALAHGQRVDRALMNELKDQIGDVKEVAPYVQMVVAFVPGIGPVVAGAIGAGVALAQGKKLSDVFIAAAAGAIPGGVIAEGAFRAGVAIYHGENAIAVAVTALPLPEAARAVLSVGVDFARRAASGERIDKVVVDSAMSGLPASARPVFIAALGKEYEKLPPDAIASLTVQAAVAKLSAKDKKATLTAVGSGMAMSHAKRIQDIADEKAKEENVKVALAKAGVTAEQSNSILNAGRALATTLDMKTGYDIGVGLMQHPLFPIQFNVVRANMTKNDELKGFDLGVSLMVGGVTAPIPGKIYGKPAGASTLAAYLTMHGLQGAHAANVASITKTLVLAPQARLGVTSAVSQILATPPPHDPKRGWWASFLSWLGL